MILFKIIFKPKHNIVNLTRSFVNLQRIKQENKNTKG